MPVDNQYKAAYMPHLPDEILTVIISFAIPDLVVRHNGVPLDYPRGLLLANSKLSDITQQILSTRKLKIYLNGTQPTILDQHLVIHPAGDALDELRRGTIKALSMIPYANFQNIEINVHPELACMDREIKSPYHHPQMLFPNHLDDIVETTITFSTLLRERLEKAKVINKTNITLKLHNICPFHGIQRLDNNRLDYLLPAWNQKNALDVIGNFAWISQLTLVRHAPEKAIQLPRLAWICNEWASHTVQESESMLRSNLLSAWTEPWPNRALIQAVASQPSHMLCSMSYWMRLNFVRCRRMVTSPPKSGFGAPEGTGSINDDGNDNNAVWNTSEVFGPHSSNVASCLQEVIHNEKYHTIRRRCEPQAVDKRFGRELTLVRNLLRVVRIDLLYCAQTAKDLEHSFAVLRVTRGVLSLLCNATYASRREIGKEKGGKIDLRPQTLVGQVNERLMPVIQTGIMKKEQPMEDGRAMLEPEEFKTRTWLRLTAEQRTLLKGTKRAYGKR